MQLPVDPLGLVHTTAAFLALGLSLAILAARKGSRFHKRLGILYGACMVGLNFTAFAIYDLFGEFAAFHWAAVASFATLLAGLWPLVRRRPGWIDRHAYFMSWSVVGLWAAAAAEAATRVFEAFFASALAASVLVIGVGAVIIWRTVPRILVRSPARASS
jgi:uncharacterized membrane protein